MPMQLTCQAVVVDVELELASREDIRPLVFAVVPRGRLNELGEKKAQSLEK